MRRRKYLATIGAGALGISGPVSAKSTDQNSSPKIAKITKQAETTVPGLGVDVWVDQPDISSDQIAEIGLKLVNNRSSDIDLAFPAPDSVNKISGVRQKGNVKAVLIGASSPWEIKDRIGAKIKHNELKPDRPDVVRQVNLSPGGTYRMQHQLWGHPESPLLPKGNYEFSRGIYLNENEYRFEFELGIE